MAIENVSNRHVGGVPTTAIVSCRVVTARTAKTELV